MRQVISVILFSISMILSSTAFAQEFFCSVRHQIGLFPEHGNWEAASNIQIEEHLKGGFIIRPPTQADVKQLKIVHPDKGWEKHPFIVYSVSLEVVIDTCDAGFNQHGYLRCDTIGDMWFNFNSNRFRRTSRGSYLSGNKVMNQDWPDLYSYGECFRR